MQRALISTLNVDTLGQQITTFDNILLVVGTTRLQVVSAGEIYRSFFGRLEFTLLP